MNIYYHITGYRFLLDNYNVFEDNYNFHKCTELIALSEIDTKLSIMFFEEIKKIEEALRTKLANLCGANDMVSFQLDDNHNTSLLKDNYCLIEDSRVKFIAEDSFNRTLSSILFSDINKTKREPANKHYIDIYNGLMPIWVVINFISFGTLIKLIDCLTTVKLNELMNYKNYKKPNNLNDPCRVDLKAIQMLRNKISHHSNILGKQSPYKPKDNNYYSIYYLGYNAICHWSKFLFNKDLTSPLKQKINKMIDETNEKYQTRFDISIIRNKKIK